MVTIMIPADVSPAGQAEAAALRAALASHAFVGGLERRLVERLAGLAYLARYAPGALIARAGDEPESLYLLIQGEVELLTSAHGAVSCVGRLSAGDVLGTERAPCRRWKVDARAVGAVSAIVLDDSSVEDQMGEDAALGPALRMCSLRYGRIHELQCGADMGRSGRHARRVWH